MDKERWYQLTFAQQMGNIGSEIARARHWENQKDLLEKERALTRAFELIDLTLSDSRWRYRRKELGRLREIIADWYSNQKYYTVMPESVEEYCISFTLNPYQS